MGMMPRPVVIYCAVWIVTIIVGILLLLRRNP
jgi:hypothetical protein